MCLPAAANASYTSCGIEPRVDHSYIPTLLVFIIIAAVVVTTRGLARLVAGVKLWWDDWANFVAMVCDHCPVFPHPKELVGFLTAR